MVYCVDVPVWMFFQHLVDADGKVSLSKRLEQSPCRCGTLQQSPLTLRNLGQVKSEFSVMAPHRQKLLIMFNCIKQTVKEMRPFYISASKQCQNVQWKVSLTFTPLTQMSNVKTQMLTQIFICTIAACRQVKPPLSGFSCINTEHISRQMFELSRATDWDIVLQTASCVSYSQALFHYCLHHLDYVRHFDSHFVSLGLDSNWLTKLCLHFIVLKTVWMFFAKRADSDIEPGVFW